MKGKRARTKRETRERITTDIVMIVLYICNTHKIETEMREEKRTVAQT